MKTKENNLLYILPTYKNLGDSLLKNKDLKLKKGKFEVIYFTQGEILIYLNNSVKNKNCFILGSTLPLNEELPIILLLADTLKKEGANNVYLISPYLSYMRQDKSKKNESLATKLIGKIFKTSGINKVITINVHSKEDIKLFPIPLISLKGTSIFLKAIKNILNSNSQEISFVSPDKGAIKLIKEIENHLSSKVVINVFNKERKLKKIKHLNFKGNLTSKAIIIDDMLDSGGTIISAVKRLKAEKVKEINIFIIHGLFSIPQKYKELLSYREVKNVYCTDSVPGIKELALKYKKIKILPSKFLIEEGIKGLI